jgi:menaquinone-dependent protoporphyrinogen oxidase
MSVLVATASRLGSTTRIGERIAARLVSDQIDAVALDAAAVDDLGPYRAVILGSGVYAGHWLPEAVHLADRHRAELPEQSIWLFSSGPVGDMATRHEAPEVEDVARLRARLRVRGHRTFAGALDRRDLDGADLGRLERFVAAHFVPEGDYRDWDAIDAWADAIAAALGADRSTARGLEERQPVPLG